MLGSQVQRLFLPSSTSEPQGQKIWEPPRGIYQVTQKMSNFNNKITERKKPAVRRRKKLQL